MQPLNIRASLLGKKEFLFQRKEKGNTHREIKINVRGKKMGPQCSRAMRSLVHHLDS